MSINIYVCKLAHVRVYMVKSSCRSWLLLCAKLKVERTLICSEMAKQLAMTINVIVNAKIYTGTTRLSFRDNIDRSLHDPASWLSG